MRRSTTEGSQEFADETEGQSSRNYWGARGIGSAIAKRFAAEGASVVINYAMRKTEAERTLAAIEAKGGKAFIFQTKERSGRLDLLVNNAGLDDFMSLEQVTEQHFHSHYNVNALGVILGSKELLYFGCLGDVCLVKKAAKHIDKKQGCILNIGSLSSTHL
jgi:3-oxoacyl-[acyl-carrier protein] reductase